MLSSSESSLIELGPEKPFQIKSTTCTVQKLHLSEVTLIDQS